MHSLWLCVLGASQLCKAAPRPLIEQSVFTLHEQSFSPGNGGRSMPVSHYNITFDNVKLDKKAKQKLDHLDPLEFIRYDIVNTSLAVEQDLLSPNDADCAVVGTNAIFTAADRYGSPSRVEFDPDTAKLYNTSHFFDFKGMTFKPLGPAPRGIIAGIYAWMIQDGKALHVYSAFAVWGASGYLHPIVADFPEYWPEWGVDVNMIEISARDPQGKRPWPLCVGRIELMLKERQGE
ncbi:hypothetical protein CLAFUW4_02138 [Fulvia fulva]|nr:hypothetical protein CLAFUR4_02134 [Fulvia fulva]KAK4637006.1 hypothetical protein CLAFUR0_02137 [Fulvia fulva]WPV08726.1 hypothetical protein CLAFUW4_02138 [Fulvia fulva]WPV23669.1 hypothetical protein CLAFUW7_02138 [Fulvia fulva]